MRGSAIARELRRVDAWVQIGRVVLIVLAASAAATQIMAARYPGTAKDPSLWPGAAVLTGVVLIVATAAESVWGLFRVRHRGRSEANALQIEKQLVSVLVQVAKEAHIDVDVAGCNVWRIYTPRHGAPALHRVGHRRLSDYPPMSDRAWTKGKGVIGRCWDSGQTRFWDFTALQEKMKNKTELSEAAWRAMKPADRWGFDRDEYLDAIRKYQQVLAVPIVDSQGQVLGCISIDIPSDRPAANPRCLDTPEVRGVLATAAETVRGLISSPRL
ncbi:hypothetical protein [Cellulomonas biazotea]|uniref:GAF domain-containing protein n=1 Tax=Cellulomonas biazotea TaxID=1709 RepID=A0A402DP24_9CELL|nr:hypothetical protein [Cellulomonas biazotea]GCE75880.1 hypothetical protein CBZ_09360 [Cellulomonas biazotea]